MYVLAAFRAAEIYHNGKNYDISQRARAWTLTSPPPVEHSRPSNRRHSCRLSSIAKQVRYKYLHFFVFLIQPGLRVQSTGRYFTLFAVLSRVSACRSTPSCSLCNVTLVIQPSLCRPLFFWHVQLASFAGRQNRRFNCALSTFVHIIKHRKHA
jgi:hypothetical protein